ncbi:PIG-L family deacetylase [Pelagibacterium luteolum]|uniref:N-acetylglucosaminyl deacetylase, LmbE family n=1 Tax=Pelagibacterium luteolum TaxID=440168 RepID=A0A1G7RYG2_9HYPH|nr:PIG-L family deacetylase [Pelagibacterium luteolum]SDG15781.1 N-acetylglucosaminyl deacetylase, LmbE family [Pelagibacterium luteolum]
MTKISARLAAHQAAPRLLTLHRALSRLTSTLTVMNTGAHPDDEHNGMLAAMRLGSGHRIVVACSTRGEGGQNALGPERQGALGIVRTREMEESAKVIDADIHWLGHGPEDPVHDFGFSKNGDDTLSRWGEDRIIERLVRAYRTERPDVVIPTFLDVPGQHGHHRAMTRAAETAIEKAADPNAYPEHLTEGLKPWRVAKFYLPAWSGGGGTYDDEVPPPNATLTITADSADPATGAAFDQIGEWSRRYHASQGMGYWDDTIQTAWPLHLKIGPSDTEASLADNIPSSLTSIAALPDLDHATRAAIEAADAAIARALAAFPNAAAISAALLEAARQLQTARNGLGDALDHRLKRVLDNIDRALLEASGSIPFAWAEPAFLTPGETGEIRVLFPQDTDRGATSVTLKTAPGLTASPLPDAGDHLRFALSVANDAPMTNPYPPAFYASGGNGPVVIEVTAEIDGRSVSSTVDLVEPVTIRPAASVTLDPDALIVRRDDVQSSYVIDAALAGKGVVSLASDGGWSAQSSGSGFTLTPPADFTPGLVTLPANIDGQPAFHKHTIAYPHIGQSVHLTPATVRILSLDLTLPQGARVGYVGGGADRVGLWLKRMRLDVTNLEPGQLDGDLSAFTTIVVGIFTFGLRPDLLAATSKLHAWIERGGHLVTLYHRPSDAWSPETVPPKPLTIGSPSLRWRVTDPNAHVEVLIPDHPLLAGPNSIGAEDWAGWDKERGLYFASQWDPAYEPLLSMHDKGEKPLLGALVSARIGNGRHTYTSLVLHHQLDKLVPGAFRLIANLVQPA